MHDLFPSPAVLDLVQCPMTTRHQNEHDQKQKRTLVTVRHYNISLRIRRRLLLKRGRMKRLRLYHISLKIALMEIREKVAINTLSNSNYNLVDQILKQSSGNLYKKANC